MKTLKSIVALTLLMGMLSAPLAAQAQEAAAPAADAGKQMAELTKFLPPNAHITVVVPHPKKFSDNVAAFAKAAGVPDDDFDDLLREFQRESGLGAGVDMEAPVAFVIPMLSIMNEPAFYFVAKVADEKAFAGGFEDGLSDVEDAEGVQTGEAKWEDYYLRRQNKWVILGNNKNVIKNWQPPKAKQPTEGDAAAAGPRTFSAMVGRGGLQTIVGSDIAVAVNMNELGQLLAPLMAVGMMQMEQEIANHPDMQMLGGPEGVKAMLALYRDVANGLLTESTALVGGLKVDKAMLSARAALQFESDAAIHKFIQSPNNSELSLAGLPAGKTFAVMAIDGRVIQYDAVQKAVTKKLKPLLDGDSAMAKLIESYMEAAKLAARPMQAAYYVNEGADSSLPFDAVAIYETDDPQQFIKTVTDSTRTIMAGVTELMKQGGLAMDDQDKPMVEIEEDALTIEGVKVTKLRVHMPFAAEGDAFAEMMTEQTSYMVPLKGRVAVVQGEADLLKPIIKGETGKPVVDAKMRKTLSERLPANRIVEGYVNIAQIGLMFNDMMQAMFGREPKPRKAVGGMPAAFAVGWSDSNLSVGYAMPAETIKLMIEEMEKRQQEQRREIVQQMQIGVQAQGNQQARVVVRGGQVQVQGGGRVVVRNGEVVEAGEAEPTAEAPNELIELTADNFEAEVEKAAHPTVVLFTADWSPAGKSQLQTLEKLLEDGDVKGKVKFATVDIDKQEKLAERFELTGLPEMVIYKDGEQVKSIQGATSAADLKAAIEEAKK